MLATCPSILLQDGPKEHDFRLSCKSLSFTSIERPIIGSTFVSDGVVRLRSTPRDGFSWNNCLISETLFMTSKRATR
jgi:hypothetical protein